MHYKERISREQVMMVSYDTMISPDNPVRLIDLICRKFLTDNPIREEWKGNKKEGRKSYPPSSMLSLLVYGYFNGISSSRKLERETYRNIEVLWLMEGLQPDHWTICEFRRDSGKLVKALLKSFRQFLLKESYASGEKVVFDGTKVKAYARREMLTTAKIQEKLKNIDKSISEYLDRLENNDNFDKELEATKEENNKLREKLKELDILKSKLKDVEQELKRSGKKHYSPNDPDAVLVKGRDGKFAGYNVQAGVDTKGHFILSDTVTTDVNDLNQIKDCVENLSDEIGVIPQEVSADKGYANISQIIDIESNETTQCYIPLQKTKREELEKQGLVFIYDKVSDTYTCSQNKILKLLSKNIQHRDAYYNVYKCRECKGCPVRNKCTTSKTGRIVKRNVQQEIIDQYKKKLSEEYAKSRIKERKGVVEHPFGTIKWLMGKFNFLLTGIDKAQIEFDIYSTAYNIKRLINCARESDVMTKIQRFNWAIA